ncbi:arylsulfatase [Haliscomenobacter hydrossis]|uniref:Sulfatase n=1 Tax=Haliscomenobacter hydrossis (strain ATCC 27775 / DSM 1100 / LMG 10767 / O) TaxID=760192 RepID=F4L3Y1_HALH1|nr:arylsulfatase [Haliscomenobacter hydrossis]AEE49698.1 sulfatase [Haliscomenobacter hydrossis DSM 1100]
MQHKTSFIIALLALFSSIIAPLVQAQTKKPNIILIMVDDMGYSDLGAYGSEIQTPNIDKLAYEGLRLREFYNNSICAPTRASLITGQYPHKAGVGYFDVNLGIPPYQGYLNKESLTFGEVLRQAGYSTLLSGKWHVGNDSLHWPKQRGFDRFFGVIGGGSNYFDAEPMPLGRQYPVVILEDNQRQKPKANSYYFTDEITNHAVQFLDEQNKMDKPFFLYLAYTAPHWPLQALPEDIAKYRGKYDTGWDALRKERLARQVKLGIITQAQADAAAARDVEVPDWDNLTFEEKQLWKAKMEVYAAMLDRADQGVGKVLAKLKELKKDDNTLIIFISDNGAPAEDMAHRDKNHAGRNTGPVGTAGSFESQGKPWSYVSNTPFRSFKSFAYEGGISSPFIAWFPGKIKAGSIAKGTAHLIDLAPTFYELAGLKYPSTYNGVSTNALQGKSLSNLLFKTEAWERGEPIFWERAGNRAVRQGKWKLVSIYPSYRWELYDLEKDRAEAQNVASQNLLVVDALSKLYFQWAQQNGVVDYDKIKPAQPLLPPARSTAGTN